MHMSVDMQQLPAQARLVGQHESSMHELPFSQQVPLGQGDGHMPPELDPPVDWPPLPMPDAPLEPLAVPVPGLLPAELLPEAEPPIVKPPAVPAPLPPVASLAPDLL